MFQVSIGILENNDDHGSFDLWPEVLIAMDDKTVDKYNTYTLFKVLWGL